METKSKNFIDKIIEKISPKWALDRETDKLKLEILELQKRNFSPLYSGRLRSARSISAEGPNIALYGHEQVRNEVRQMYLTNSICSGIIQRFTQCTVGIGIIPQVIINYDISREEKAKIEKLIETAWDKYALNSEFCDITKTNNFYEMQRLIAKKFFEDGEVFIHIIRGNGKQSFSIEIIEADRVYSQKKPNTVYGIEFDPETGEPIAYNVLDSIEDSNKKSKVIRKYGENGNIQMIHLFMQQRPGQFRGYPLLAPAIQNLQDLDKYLSAEKTSAILCSCFGISIETNRNLDLPIDEVTGETIQEFQPGFVSYLQPGETIKAFQYERPNSQFSSFVRQIMQEIAIAVNLPYAILFQDLSQVNFSSARYAGIESYKVFKVYQDFFINHYFRQIFNLFIDDLIISGKVVLPRGMVKEDIEVVYVCPRYTHMDPNKEATAHVTSIKNGLKTLADCTDNDWSSTINQRIREIRYILDECRANEIDPNLILNVDNKNNISIYDNEILDKDGEKNV